MKAAELSRSVLRHPLFGTLEGSSAWQRAQAESGEVKIRDGGTMTFPLFSPIAKGGTLLIARSMEELIHLNESPGQVYPERYL